MGDTTNTGGDGANGAGAGDGNDQQDQGQNDGAGNADAKGSKKEYEQLPDDHPLVKRLEAQKQQIAELKPKAKIVDDATNAAKTDAEKITALQAQVDGLPKAVAASLREHLVALHSFDKDDADLFLTGDTPELLLKQANRLLEQGGDGSKKRNYVKNEGGATGKPPESENGKFAKSLFAGSSDD